MADQLSLEADVVVEFGDFRLDVPLGVERGGVVALTGPNGAGKTTLLRALAGVQPLDAGRIVIGAQLVDEPASRTWVPPERRHVGVVFQDHRLFPSMTAADNVAFGLRARGVGRRAAHEAAEDWIATVGLAGRGETPATRLSGGQAQRVALARALAIDPDVVLLDEPFASVDDASRRAMLDVLAGLDATTVIATHDQEVVSMLADEVVELTSGQVS